MHKPGLFSFSVAVRKKPVMRVSQRRYLSHKNVVFCLWMRTLLNRIRIEELGLLGRG